MYFVSFCSLSTKLAEMEWNLVRHRHESSRSSRYKHDDGELPSPESISFNADLIAASTADRIAKHFLHFPPIPLWVASRLTHTRIAIEAYLRWLNVVFL